MGWVTIIFAGLCAIAVIGVVTDEVRARLTQPHGKSPLSGMTVTDGLIALGFVVPILFAGWQAMLYL
jgi:hypothetical protein